MDLLEISQGVINVTERHGFVNKIIDHTGEARSVALSKLVKLAAKSPGWKRYTGLVRLALAQKRAKLNIDTI